MFLGWSSFWNPPLFPCIWEKECFLLHTPALPAFRVAVVTTDLHIESKLVSESGCDPLKYVANKALRMHPLLEPLRWQLFPRQIHTLQINLHCSVYWTPQVKQTKSFFWKHPYLWCAIRPSVDSCSICGLSGVHIIYRPGREREGLLK